MTTPVAYYDADCGFCTKTARIVARTGVRARLEPLQQADLAAHGIDSQHALEEMAFVDERGRVVYGHHAWAGILRTGNPLFWLVGTLLDAPVIEQPAAWVYRQVADNREKMPGGTPACGLDQRS